MLYLRPDDTLPTMLAKLDLENCRTALALYPQLSRESLDRVMKRAYAVLNQEEVRHVE